MSYSRVTVFNPRGQMIAELDGVGTIREWVLDDVGTCTFSISIFDPNFSQANIQFGNFLLIQHVAKQNADGSYCGSMPDWVGVIDTPRTWNADGSVDITAYSAEQLLKKRACPQKTYSGNLSDIAMQMINDTNVLGCFPINQGVLSQGGEEVTIPGGAVSKVVSKKKGLKKRKTVTKISVSAKTSMYDHMLEAVKACGNDFDITGQVSGSGQLSLYLNVYDSKGYYSSVNFEQGYNIMLTNPILTEQGTIYNLINGYTSDGSADTAYGGASGANGERDLISQQQYGSWSENLVPSTTGLSALISACQSELEARSQPVQTWALTVLDEGQTFANLDCGSVWNLIIPNVGFTNGKLGTVGQIQITAVRYFDFDVKGGRIDTCDVIAVQYSDNLNNG